MSVLHDRRQMNSSVLPLILLSVGSHQVREDDRPETVNTEHPTADTQTYDLQGDQNLMVY